MIGSVRTFAALTLAVLAVAGVARAEDLDCRNGSFPSMQEHFGLARVAGTGKLNFLADMNGCPNDTAACRQRPYVLPGDTLITGRDHGPYVCAFFPNNVGGAAGWVPRDRVTALPATPPPLSAWLGHWSDGDNNIIVSKQGKALKLDGEAFWPSANPSPEERPGGPNIGALSGLIAPRDGQAEVGDGDMEVCKARLILLPPFLIASDNGGCGGMNVRFDGVYRRR